MAVCVFFCLFCCFCVLYVSSGGEVEDYMKCELIGGGCRHLTLFPNLFIVGCIHRHHVVHYKISEHNMSCCY